MSDLQVDFNAPSCQIWIQRRQCFFIMLSFSIPSREEIRNKVIEAFNIHPCEFQITDAFAQLQRKEVVTISPTGSGKTLTFWIPLLFNNKGYLSSATCHTQGKTEAALIEHNAAHMGLAFWITESRCSLAYSGLARTLGM